MEIEIDQLGKRFQHGWVFKNLHHLFQSNQIYGVSGRNGSGKSTFLKIVSGLLSPSIGKVNYSHLNQPIKREDIYTHVSIAAPYTDLIEEYNLHEMIAFHISLKPSDVFTSIDQWMDMLEFPTSLTRPLYQFSSGMKQRVKLGLALYSQSDIILLDEPTSNLDESAKAWFFDQLNKRRANKLIFIASNEDLDFKYCSEIISLNS